MYLLAAVVVFIVMLGFVKEWRTHMSPAESPEEEKDPTALRIYKVYLKDRKEPLEVKAHNAYVEQDFMFIVEFVANDDGDLTDDDLDVAVIPVADIQYIVVQS